MKKQNSRRSAALRQQVQSLGLSLLALAGTASFAQLTQAGNASLVKQTFPLADTTAIVVSGGKAEPMEYLGRKAIRLTTEKDNDIFAFVNGTAIQDGTIDVDIAVKITTPPGIRMPGFTGIAFRARPDGSRYDMFYLRPAIPFPTIRPCATTPCSMSLSRDSTGILCAANGRQFMNPGPIFNRRNGPT
jgi:hypothetical protein